MTTASAIPGLDQDCTRLVAVLGTSFSGSTLLNFMLGAHPEIYGGGELIGLLIHRDELNAGTCTSCGFDCAYWNEANRRGVTKESLYSVARQAFGRRIIVDTSKSLGWFRDVLAAKENATVEPVYLLMVKHPIRYLASCVVNIPAPRLRRRSRRIAARLGPRQARKLFLAELAEDLSAYYADLFLTFGKTIGEAPFHLLHYEWLIENPRRALKPLFRTLGLAYDARMDDQYSVGHHQIGGNSGPLYQAGRSWHGGEAEIPAFRRAFYEAKRGLRIDDKYREVFSESEIARLRRDPVIADLCDRLGYDRPDMPFRI